MKMSHTVESLRNKVIEAAKVIEAVPAVRAVVDEDDDSGEITYGEYAQTVVWKRLEDLGIYEDAESHELLMSPECSEGEARRVFCENGIPRIPSIRFKKVWSILRGGDASEDKEDNRSDVEKFIDANRPVAEWKDERLLSEYNPELVEVEDRIIQELMKRSHDRPFVAYKALNNPNNVISGKVTLDMLKVARKRDTGDQIKLDGELYILRKADDFPGQMEEVCPIHSGVLLMNGYCSECNESWDGVDYDARQFVRVMCDEDEGPKSRLELKTVVRIAQNGLDKLGEEFVDVLVLFNRLKDRCELPSLKRDQNEGTKDPFRPGGRSY